MKVTLSGSTFDEISGGSFWQQDHADIAGKFEGHRHGFGWRLVADLTAREVDALHYELIAQAELLESGGTDDDALYRRIAAGLRRDAGRIRA